MEKDSKNPDELQANLPYWKKILSERLSLPHWSLIDNSVHKLFTYFVKRDIVSINTSYLAEYCGLSLATLERRISTLKDLSILTSNVKVWRHNKKWHSLARYELIEDGMIMLDHDLYTFNLSSVTKKSSAQFPWHSLLKNKKEMAAICREFQEIEQIDQTEFLFDLGDACSGSINSNGYEINFLDLAWYANNYEWLNQYFYRPSKCKKSMINTEGHYNNNKKYIFYDSYQFKIRKAYFEFLNREKNKFFSLFRKNHNLHLWRGADWEEKKKKTKRQSNDLISPCHTANADWQCEINKNEYKKNEIEQNSNLEIAISPCHTANADWQCEVAANIGLNKQNPYHGILRRTKFPSAHSANAAGQADISILSTSYGVLSSKKENTMNLSSFIEKTSRRPLERKKCVVQSKKKKRKSSVICQSCEKYVDYWNQLSETKAIPRIMKTRAGKPTKGFQEALKFFHAFETGKLFKNSRSYKFTPEYLSTFNMGKFSKAGYSPETMFQIIRVAAEGYTQNRDKNLPDTFSAFLYTEYGYKAKKYGGGVSRFLEVVSEMLEEDTDYNDEMVDKVISLPEEDREVFCSILCKIYHETRNDGEYGELHIPAHELENLLNCLHIMRKLYDQMYYRLTNCYMVKKGEEQVTFYWFCNMYYEIVGVPDWEDAPMSYLFDKRKPYLGKFIEVVESVL